MSFPPGMRLPMTRPLYATSTMPPGAMMVQMAPVRPAMAMVPVSQVVVRPVMRPIIRQSQATFVSTPIQRQALTQVVTSQTLLHGQQVWIQSAEPAKSAFISKPPELKKDLIDNSSKSQSSETVNEPAITVFVGNITDRASDTLVRQLLMKCGSVYSWKRVQGPSGKLQAFGFCEYKDPESALRAIHILHEYALGDKKLLVKVDAKTQELIDNWKKEKGMKDDDSDSSSKLPGVKEALSGIEALVQGYSGELAVAKSTSTEKPDVLQILKPDPTVRDSTNIEENLEELQLEEDQKHFISKEIRSFRESQKQQEERFRQYKAEREKARSREIMLRERSRMSRSNRDYYRRTWSPRSRSPRSRSPRSRSPRSRSPRSRRSRSHRSRRSRSRRSRSRRSRSRRSRSRRSRSHRSRSHRSRSRRSRSRRSRSSRSLSSRSRSPRSLSSRSRTPRSRTPRRRRSRSVSPYHRSPRGRSGTPPRPLIRRVSPRRTPSRRRSRSPPPRRRSSSRSHSWSHDEDDTDWEERRRSLDRRIKEKEASYQERLDNFETREKRQKRIYEKRAEQEAAERDEMVKEAKKLREFLADYDDEKQDYLFYSGVVLKKKMQDRDVEIKEDEEDKRKEAEEVGLLKDRLVQENHPNPDGLMKKIVAEADEIWKPLLEAGSPHSTPSSSDREASRSSSSSPSEYESYRSHSCCSSASGYSDDQSVEYETEVVTAEPSNHIETTNHRPKSSSKSLKTNSRYSSSAGSSSSNPYQIKPHSAERSKLKFKQKTLHSTSIKTKRRKLTVSDVFNQDDEEEIVPKKKKFVPMHLSNIDKKASRREDKVSSVDKKKRIRALIDRIPTEKDDLFQFEVDWSVIDSVLMEKRIKPWITKKIIEYIGENEPTLVEFISSKIMTKSSPSKILEDISMVLDEEADVFVAKLWRLVIYETEARKEGLTKL